MPPAGVVGRVGKLAVGAIERWFVYQVAAHLVSVLQTPPRSAGFWVFVAWAFWLVAPVANLGRLRERALGSRPTWWAAAAWLLLAGTGRAVWGTWWSLPAAAFSVVLAASVHGYVGLSHLASAVIGFPGCELRALAYLVARARGTESTFAACPGAWTPLDRWEARVRGRG